ncbi:hypothetical protein PUNSTDRAFT_124253 [Punctularia strigosozonata HHB-11173 SS5]|uniref:uncharacterized protein n=1 Tax=Punctularia strigosozonata (strain HHB-11173) TaxID=741275 RepID=UPI0004417C21|nr:uncharacterized protein PUNSTDRAFT_124253 [Punctularia strigosozonata HHB-11173 SS5]EIN12370.1 hypothetical protein PUNSTDRAFT_124253 [Punctularia strigosozonata HHB-11173 SS5]
MAGFQPAAAYSSVRDQTAPAMSVQPPPAATQSWASSQTPPTAGTSASTSQQPGVVYSPVHPQGEHFDYAAATSADYASRYQPQSSNALPPHAVDLSMPQVESSIGPSRVLTRRAAKMAQQNKAAPNTSSTSSFYVNAPSSRADSPNTYINNNNPYPSTNAGSMAAPHSPYISTSSSSSSSYSHYGFFPSHARSASGSTSNARSASPALSIASAVTSMSSASVHSSWQSIASLATTDAVSTNSREKHKKNRLYNVDRRSICQFHKDNPSMRQEDIARRFGVERSTISKILKNKAKWLHVRPDEEMKIAKHRPSKFPEIEMELQKWLVEMDAAKQILTDASIRQKAKEVARTMEIPEDKFKASSGWIENFKHRHGIRRGVWQGDGKNTRAARAMGCGHPPEEESDNAAAKKPKRYIHEMTEEYYASIGVVPTYPHPSVLGPNFGIPLDGDIEHLTPFENGDWLATLGQPPPREANVPDPAANQAQTADTWTQPSQSSEAVSPSTGTPPEAQSSWQPATDADQQPSGSGQAQRASGLEAAWPAPQTSASPHEESAQPMLGVTTAYPQSSVQASGTYEGMAECQASTVSAPEQSQGQSTMTPSSDWRTTIYAPLKPAVKAAMKVRATIIGGMLPQVFGPATLDELLQDPHGRLIHAEQCLDQFISWTATQPGFISPHQKEVLGELKSLMVNTEMMMRHRS